MGNSGDTPDAQSSPKKDVDSVGSTDGVVDAPQSVPSRFEESQVNIVTRAGDWMTIPWLRRLVIVEIWKWLVQPPYRCRTNHLVIVMVM